METKTKWTSQPWVPPFLSYELWKQQIQTASKYHWDYCVIRIGSSINWYTL